MQIQIPGITNSQVTFYIITRYSVNFLVGGLKLEFGNESEHMNPDIPDNDVTSSKILC